MNIVRVIVVLILLGVLAGVMQLPDPNSETPMALFQSLNPDDFVTKAKEEWKENRRASALVLLDYAIENQLPDASVAAHLREGYWAAMKVDRSVLGRLQSFGHDTVRAESDWFDSLGGTTLADAVAYSGLRDIASAMAQQASPDEFVQLLREAREIPALFPPAEPVVSLIIIARMTGVIRPPLAEQWTSVIRYIRTSPDSSQALTAIQESIMPVHQLARKCKTWVEFDTLLRCAGSVDQVKALAALCSTAPGRAHRLTQVLSVSGKTGSDPASRVIAYSMRGGPKGMDALYLAARKGAEGVRFVLDHPHMTADVFLRDSAHGTLLLAKPRMIRWWQRQLSAHGHWPLWGKYGAIAIVCGLLVMVVMPPRTVKQTLLSVGPLSGIPVHQVDRYYWMGVVAVSATFCLLFMLPLVSSAPPPGGVMNAAGGWGGAKAGALPLSSGWSLAVLLVVVMIVQGGCWWLAHRKLREVEMSTGLDVQQSLKRLENLDIFLDLPLYCGLALTICAFILISTFGAGISRFLAYASTFVGILLTVVLRAGYLYPMRERLLAQSDPMSKEAGAPESKKN